MASISLRVLDEGFGARCGPLIVPRLKQKSGGLDPLGLGQINFLLMDEVLPGINNVTTLVRPYSLMTWAWWKAVELAKQAGGKVEVERLRAYVERVDLIFVMSQLMRDAAAELPGKIYLGKWLDHDSFDFDEAEWRSRFEVRRTSTSLMAPVQYGPSIRSQSGLGWLVPEPESGVLVPVEQVMPAIEALDRLLNGRLPHALRSLDGARITHAEVEALGEVWPANAATDAEKEIFRARFCGDGSELSSPRLKKRRATVELMVAALRSFEEPATTDLVRKRMFDGPNLWKIGAVLSAEARRAQQIWVVLQLRQLQRLATEALFAFVEQTLREKDRPVTSAALAEGASVLAAADLGGSSDNTLADAFASSVSGEDVGEELFILIEAITVAQRAKEREEGYERLPGLTLRAFGLVYRAVVNLQLDGLPKEFFGGDADRLPMREFARRIAARLDDRVGVFWREVIEVWVLGQHVRWAVARNGDETQRLRVVLDEGGWVPMPRPNVSRFATTQDRLHSALCLAELSGMIELDSAGLWAA